MRRGLVLLGALCVLSLSTVPASAAQVAAAGPRAYPVTICSTLSVSTQQTRPGQSITVSGTNFKADATVHLVVRSTSGGDSSFATADGDELGTVTTDARGSFTAQVTLPGSATVSGSYVIVATTGARTGQGCPAEPSQSLDLLAAATSTSTGGGSTSSGGTAFTGLDVASLIAVALALIGAGAALTLRGRRSASAHR